MLDIAREYGTPSFVFDTVAFKRRWAAIRDIWGDDIKLCFAIKANPFLVPSAAEMGGNLEVCSPGELDICKALGVDPATIVFSGVNKTAQSVHDACEFGVGVLTAESLHHIDLLEAEGAARGEVLPVLPRLNAGSQFGMSRADLLWLVEHRAGFPHVRIVGIHHFAGTQRVKLKHQRKDLAMLSDLIDELRDGGLEIERLEYGPGLATPVFMDDDFSDTLAPARELADDLRAIASKVELTIEMGRFFAAECGTYLTGVNDLKENEGTRYCIVDGGINHLTYIGQLMGMKTPVIENLSAADRGETPSGTLDDDASLHCICGSLCTTGDILARKAPLPSVQRDDVLAFHNCGAYAVTEGVHLFLSRTMPRIILRGEDRNTVLARDFTESSPLNTIGSE
ncbi:MAG: diaminopimelate decarboxylase family protein [Coriobacteriales bacterium]